MSTKLIPRFNTEQAGSRFSEIQKRVAEGAKGHELVRLDMGAAMINPTGGEAPTSGDLQGWRSSVMDRMKGIDPSTKETRDQHGVALGRAISECIAPSPSDAGHDGVWSFLSLWLFPDVVLLRWGASADGGLPVDRWVGAQLGRDRNYFKLSWRRWQVLGDVMSGGTQPLGEDEFGALLERTSMARNAPLIRAAARQVLGYRGTSSRMDFTRTFMKELTYLSGPLQLDVLDEEDLQALVHDVAENVLHRAHPRRAVGSVPPD